jgi:uncharacterized membrane protein
MLALILAFALALRLYRLGDGLWLDEIMTYVNYAKIPAGETITTYDSQNQHFLYSLLAHASFLIFGESAWSLRLPATLFGVASIWALYLLGRQVTNTREALFSCLLLAVSYHHIWFSQNARGYTGLLFWTILSSWIFLRSTRESRPALWLVYALSSAAGMYTHLTMLFVVSGHFIIYSVLLITRTWQSESDRWLGLFLGFCLAGFFTLLLYALVLPQIFGETIKHGRAVAAWKNPFWTLIEFIRGMQTGFKGFIPAIIALIIFSVGLFSFARKNPIVIGLLFIPAIICAVVTTAMGHHLWPRLFFFTFGFATLIIVRGTMEVARILASWMRLPYLGATRFGTALCLALILVSVATVPSVYYPKQDYSGALAFLQKNQEPGDVIATVGATVLPYKKFYGVDWHEIESVETLNKIRSYAKRTWLTYTLPVHLESVYPDVMVIIRNDFTVVKKFYGTLNGGTIFVCLDNAA